ncbi:MFS transporter [Rubrobacter indicoceani]|uniref:MFS transporter n=1 Tax=Rubrobacter indicoceani TaxID=2051957 RepID=UPI000E5C0433|nr:MFS transporter [Rubrobacter indicoceani]
MGRTGFSSTGRAAFFALLVSQMAATTGFLFVMPFMPLYVEQLGVGSARDAAAWAGVLNAATAVTMAATAPLWGRVADRFGPKSMLLRASIAGAIVVGLMGLVTGPWQLLWLRLLQGCLTGTVAAATLLASETAPAGRGGSRLGTLQTVIFLAAAVGPFVGGVFADLVGIRASFGVTAGLLALSSVLVLLFVGDVKPERSGPESEDAERTPIPWGRLVPVLVALFVVQTSITAVAPALPGFIATLVDQSSGIASLSGRVLGAGALAAALGALVGGRIASRVGSRAVITFALLLAGLAFLPQAAVGGVFELGALRVVASFFLGAIVPVANLAIKEAVPPERQGSAFGVAASATSVAFGVGPLGGGFLAAQFGFGAPFMVPAFLLFAAVCVMALAPRSRRRAVRVLKAAVSSVVR